MWVLVSAQATNVRRPPCGYLFLAIGGPLTGNADQKNDAQDAMHMPEAYFEAGGRRSNSPGTLNNAPITTADDGHEPPPIKGAPLSSADSIFPDRAVEPLTIAASGVVPGKAT